MNSTTPKANFSATSSHPMARRAAAYAANTAALIAARKGLHARNARTVASVTRMIASFTK